MRTWIRAVVAAILAVPMYGQVPIFTDVEYERLFFPVGRIAVPGANGTVWGSEIVIRNESATPVDIFHSDCSYHCRCRVFVMCQPQQRTPGKTAYASRGGDLLINHPSNIGAFLYVERARVDDVVANARLVNFTRLDENLGTELPVVREREFRTGTLWLTNVPMDLTARQHLRVSAVPRAETESVRVRMWDQQSEVLLGETTLTLMDVNLGALARPFEYPTEPDFAELSNLRARFNVDALVTRVRIEIEPLSSGMRFWAFVSATDNTTQHVTLVTPQ